MFDSSYHYLSLPAREKVLVSFHRAHCPRLGQIEMKPARFLSEHTPVS
jgi:hypothetical protein